MRWCGNCRKFNADWPVRCRYCGAGLEGRLCPRNHVNPVDSKIAFCGECGGVLERRSGAAFSVVPYLFAVGSFLAAVTAGAFVLVVAVQTLFSALVFLGLLFLGIRLAFGILPPSSRRFTAKMFGALLEGLLGTGNKGRVRG